jgi:flavin reductase ActVB
VSGLDLAAFRNALGAFASGVTVVTTKNAEGTPFGFTATSFASLSLSPPLVLVCLAHTADCYPVFIVSDRFAINVLGDDQAPVATRFAQRGTDKFADLPFSSGASSGMPILAGASAHLECRVFERLPSGDHTILVGEVIAAHRGTAPPLLYHDRRFGSFQPA